MKSIFGSRTIWTAVGIAAISAFEPVAQEHMANHPGIVGASIAFVMILLRMSTKQPVRVIKRKKKQCDGVVKLQD